MKRKVRRSDAWSELDQAFSRLVPHFASYYGDEEDFIDCKVKNMPDGTWLVIAKKYNGDGSPMVLFGAGYGFVGAIMAADASMQGDRWKPDKPWRPKDK